MRDRDRNINNANEKEVGVGMDGGGVHSHSQTVEVTVCSIWKVFWQIQQYLTVTLRPLENNSICNLQSRQLMRSFM